MDPVTHSITGSRSLTPAAIKHWQATPMRVTLTLESGQNITGASSIIAEIHSERGSDPSSILASVEISVTDTDGPWTIDFTAPQMNQSVSAPYRMFWFIFVAQYPTADRLEILACATIQLNRHNASLTTATPPDPSTSYLTAAQIAALYATITDFDDLEARVADLEANSTGGGASSLVIRIVDATGDATDTALHLAYNPLALTIPAESPAGFSGALQSHTPGTVKLVLTSGFEIVYDGLPAGSYGRPVVAFRGGRIDYLMIAPHRIIIRGDYVATTRTWHPTDEGDNLLGLWKAGATMAKGGHAWHPCSEAVGVSFPSTITNRWEALFGSTKNARFIYDWAANTDGGGDQGDSPTTYAPILVTDSNFPNGYAYALREGSATSHVMRALKDENTNLVPTAPCRIYIAARQTATGASAGSFLRINSSNAYFVGTKSGLVWYAATWGYQFVHDNSAGSFATKPVGTTLEEVTTPVLLTLVITAGGAGSVYVGTTLVSNPLSINTAATISFLQFYAAQNIRLGGVAVINGTSSDLPTEIAAMQAILIS